jgi:predicted HTH domain antitoxin
MSQATAMKSVNVQQLKSNPSKALRLARKQPLVVMNHDQPEAILLHVDNDELLAEDGVRVALALALYKQESLSLGGAAKLANMPPAEFMQYASWHGIATFRGSMQSAREDAKTLDAWLKKRSS